MEREKSVFAADPTRATRLKEIPESQFKCQFLIDRDRIIHSKEFRRLSGKTQVFITGFDDNMRTRLTHTIEVAQIADTISRNIGLNTALTEAIALGHDVGHTPFGHIGERTLNALMNGCLECFEYHRELKEADKGFKHNLQGIRVATMLEKLSPDEPGLNLTQYTLWGIMNHTSSKLKTCDYCDQDHKQCGYLNIRHRCNGEMSLGFYTETLMNKNHPVVVDERDWTLEGVVVAVADEIAQRRHDAEDGIFAGIIEIDDLFQNMDFPEDRKEKIEEIKNAKNRSAVIHEISELIVNHYCTEYIRSLQTKLDHLKADFAIESADVFFGKKAEIYEHLTQNKTGITDALGLEPELLKKDNAFQEYLKNHVLQSELAQSMDGKSAYFIRQLVKAYLVNPQQLPDQTIIWIAETLPQSEYKAENPNRLGKATLASEARSEVSKQLKNGNAKAKIALLRKICDHIAGMTDHYAIQQVEKLYGTGAIRNY